MKRTITLAAIVLAAVLCFPATASAGHGRAHFGFGFGFGFGGGHVRVNYHRGHYRHHHHSSYRCLPRYAPVHHIHTRVAVYSQVWVPPVYDTIVIGYDACGNPIYRTVLRCAGYYRNVVTGHRCGSCNEVLY